MAMVAEADEDDGARSESAASFPTSFPREKLKSDQTPR